MTRATHSFLIGTLFVGRFACRAVAGWTTLLVVLAGIIAVVLRFGYGYRIDTKPVELPAAALLASFAVDGMLAFIVTRLDRARIASMDGLHKTRAVVRSMMAHRAR